MADETNKTHERRQGYWDELEEAEKTERMRQEVKNLQSCVAGLINKVEELEEHEHLDGRIVVPYGGKRPLSTIGMGGRIASTKKDVFF